MDLRQNDSSQEGSTADEVREFETFETSFDITADDNPVNFADNVVADAETVDENNIENMTLEGVSDSADLNLEDMSVADGDGKINASLEEIKFDDVAGDDLTLDEITARNNAANSGDSTNLSFDSEQTVQLDEITFDDAPANSDRASENLNRNDINLDDLGFEETTSTDGKLAADLNLTTDSNKLSEDRSNDMNNISEWLDSLETPAQSNDNITDWLDTLDRDDNGQDTDVVQSSTNVEAETNLEAEADDISFQFLEDLLDRSNDEQDRG